MTRIKNFKTKNVLCLIVVTSFVCLCFSGCSSPDTHPFSIDVHEAKIFEVNNGFKFADIDSKYPGNGVLGKNDYSYMADEAEKWNRAMGGTADGMVAFVVSFDMYYTTIEKKEFKELKKQYKDWEFYEKGSDYLPFLNRFLCLGQRGDPNLPPNPTSITKYIKVENIDRKKRIIKNCTLFGVIDKSIIIKRSNLSDSDGKIIVSYTDGENNFNIPLNIEGPLLAEMSVRQEALLQKKLLQEKRNAANLKMRIDFAYQKNQNTVTLVKDKFHFIDDASGKEIAFTKMVIDGETVVGMRSYSDRSNDRTVAEFSMTGGKSVQYFSYGLLALPIIKNYKLENGTLTIVDE
ncbi:MAG: hypothetical protein LBQ60_16590 [Bacteroidales bacterium]|jgi:hypothetical protein|nr:hypothetical protein [Bacteroidales bacterium]